MNRRGDASLAPYLMVAPATVLLLALILAPLALVVATAFTDWHLGGGAAAFVGFDTFVTLLDEPDFRTAVWNTARYVVFVVPATSVAGLVAALLIAECRRGQALYRMLFFLPSVATLAAMSVAWQMLLSPSVGALPQILRLVGLTPGNWLQDPDRALSALGLIGIWSEAGFAMLFFLAGLKTVPAELHEAAALDGVGTLLDRLWHVTLPHLAPITAFVLVFSSIHALRVFDTVAIMTRGGPEKSTLVALYFIYQEAFSLFRTNLAAAATVLFIAAVLLLSLLQLYLTRARGGR
ncbi:multiple sugar transport system permease protein [Enhydrobacter aerosaccus]|uniref:Multiple sugar transport system permease protein n=1 Tax=Enhydrobacter aerosaccus TaxID=225324 RepID=A0A1T4LTH2_9HYPH|nr:sugar ABC transporter permease [Enhydrobacter aerosaccus]SJZ57975.1 multiple sugar transport system permease protein [Enhydrobacter aerosaccus]